ncbi:helix-turn-helix domain-containing protein [Terasakiella sp. A23]|uniref:helix-turn-helix domain-containing protein n=1 Tax=Terasakiella sp. FCG-A23 TaxID=3080561 RepID=UPI002952995C|nr:helix-turn-helix domain-containing protein [Terasakiella sp. A23]MDV7338879.1 helix-turn-helix domain-containing protein [Terasakiella sp. A23]
MHIGKNIDISEVSKLSGLPASTLRYYEEKGLIKSVGRQGLRRLFHDTVLEQLNFISLASRANFSLTEIQEMFSIDGQINIDRDKLVQKADVIDQHIKELQAVSEGLRHAAVCSAPSHFECPTFQKFMRVAGKSNAKKRK